MKVGDVLHYLVDVASGLSDVNRQEFHDALDEEGLTVTPPPAPETPADQLHRERLIENIPADAEIAALEARLAELRAGQ